MPAQVNTQVATQLFGNYADEVSTYQTEPKQAKWAKPNQPYIEPAPAMPHSNLGPTQQSIHTGLGDKVDQLATTSPTLAHQLATIQKLKWTIQFGDKKGCGSDTDSDGKIITIDPREKGNPLLLLQSLSHEIGHALFLPAANLAPDGLTRQQYIDRNVNNDLKNEAHATINNMLVRAELLKAKQGDIGVAGAQSKQYLELFDKYPDIKDRNKLREEIAKIFGHGERPSTAPKLDYYQFYAKDYADKWDSTHPK